MILNDIKHRLSITFIILALNLMMNPSIFSESKGSFQLLLNDSDTYLIGNLNHSSFLAQVASDTDNNNANNDNYQVESSDRDNRRIEQDSYTENNESQDNNQDDSSISNPFPGLTPPPLSSDVSESMPEDNYSDPFLLKNESNNANDQVPPPIQFSDLQKLKQQTEDIRRINREELTQKINMLKSAVEKIRANKNIVDTTPSELLSKEDPSLTKVLVDDSGYQELNKTVVKDSLTTMKSETISSIKEKQNLLDPATLNEIKQMSQDQMAVLSADDLMDPTIRNEIKQLTQDEMDTLSAINLIDPAIQNEIKQMAKDQMDGFSVRDLVDPAIQNEMKQMAKDQMDDLSARDIVDPAIQDEMKQMARDQMAEHDPLLLARELQQELGYTNPEELIHDVEQSFQIDHPENISIEELEYLQQSLEPEINAFQEMLNNLPEEQQAIEIENAPPHLRPFLNP